MASKDCLTALMFALAATAAGFACAAPPGPAGGRPGTSVPAGDAALSRQAGPPGKPASGAPGPAFEYAYIPPASRDLKDIYRRVREADLWRQLPEVQEIDGMFALPRRLRFVTAECGEPGAFYRPEQAEVVLCYETLRALYAQGQAHQQALGLGKDHPLRYLRANVRFMVLHETGHALVDLLDLPVTGRQEDAVDQLAAILMLRFGGLAESPGEVIDDLRLVANWMLTRSTGAYDLDAFADEHALGEQRFFNLQCLIYGTDPDDFAGMIEAGDLTAARAAGCPRESRQTSRAWVRLLLPHLAPGREAYADEAVRYLERGG
ncbi:DUF4344 domain-containing metallopeptidase [Pseudoxanthomonas daejeonensis]|uniref:DUF4344 domain-containing metallopeptidase n=1 Tax=Pseudoxanthomonas daejeonensis TaxID=266062 RepID=UPI001F546BF1|nr:DUF4344 domain-containing metallopeptidase [Pseudoxanthomonas daejeonensis]UNK57220.1 DUF4344 domain-containing metallopeptidase [Pseudoxanthomonas daejeonensis]